MNGPGQAPEVDALAEIIDGKGRAREMREGLARQIALRTAAGKRAPGLVTILVGEDPPSQIYVARKQRESKEIGMHSESVELPASVSMDEVLDTIDRYNNTPDIDGILLQLPLPEHLSAERGLSAIDPAKDVDGLHPLNQGSLFTGRPGLRPCTPVSCMLLLDSTGIDLRGKHAVVVGSSALVGKPVAMMLLERFATVVLCHVGTADLREEVSRAEVLVVAVGKPKLVKGDWIKPGAVVIDVGINRVDGKLVGDVEFEVAVERASYITPVPGGVGPMTVAMLLQNTYDACVAREL